MNLGMNWDQIHGRYKAKTEAKRLEVKEARKNADQPAFTSGTAVLL